MRPRAQLLSAILVLLLLPACGGGRSTSSGTGGASGSCDPDVLHTGIKVLENGVSVDAFDCAILTWAATYAEPDPMILKAMIDVESHFDVTSVGCSGLPCGTPSGWTAAESGCYGLMQIVPACGDDPDGAGLLPDGQPNLTTDATSSGWSSSVFNPEVNIENGAANLARKRSEVKAQFSGCTEDQYTLMAVGNYEDNGSASSCTAYNAGYVGAVLAVYDEYAAAAAYPAHAY